MASPTPTSTQSPQPKPPRQTRPALTKTRYPGIYRLASGRYQVYYRDPSGRQRTATFRRLDQAREFKESTQVSVRAGTWIDPEGAKVSFGDWLEVYLAAHVVRRTTQDSVFARINAHIKPRWEDHQLGPHSIRRIAVQGWVKDLHEQCRCTHPREQHNILGCREVADGQPCGCAGWRKRLAVSTIKSIYTLFHAIMEAAVDEGLIAANPCRKISLPKGPARAPVALTPTQAGDLLAELLTPDVKPDGTRVHLGPGLPGLAMPSRLVLTTLVTGLRWGEATGLVRGDVNLLRRVAAVVEPLHEDDAGERWKEAPKSPAGAREVPLPATLVDVLAAWLPKDGEPDDLIFVGARGKPLSRHNFNRRAWQPAVKAAGLPPLRFHDLRHTYTSWLADEDIPRHVRMELLGHSRSGDVHERYTHTMPGMDRRVRKAVERRLEQVLAQARKRLAARGLERRVSEMLVKPSEGALPNRDKAC